jgi:hypothetical protein
MTEIISHKISGSDVVSHFLSTMDTAGDRVKEHFGALADAGDFYSLAPRDVAKDRLKQFRAGGVFPAGPSYSVGKHLVREVPNHSEELALVVEHHAATLQNPIVLLHEPYLTPMDKSEIAHELIRIDGAFYKIVRLRQAPAANLAQDIGRFTVSWHALIILADDANDTFELARIVQSAKLIAVGAYDGESYVYWIRRIGQ